MNYVINPKTNRPVKMGSRTHRQLICDAINRIEARDSSCIYDGDENGEPDIEKFNKKLQYLCVYNNKIIARYKKIKSEQLLNHIIKVIPNVIDSYLGQVDEADDSVTLKNKLIQCLHNKLLE